MEEKYLKALVTHIKASHHIDKFIKQDMLNYGVSANEFMILELLYNRGPQPIQKIGESVILTSGTMTYIVDQLVKKGFVMRQKVKNDHRVTLVSLSEEGELLIKKSFPLHQDEIMRLFGVLSKEEIDCWIELNKKMGFYAQGLNQRKGEPV